ncbi:MAG: exosortase/archaeosortase family protein [Anaerolineae bacterium]
MKEGHERGTGWLQGLALAVAGALGVWLFAGTGTWLVHQWWTGEYYTHGPLVVAVAGGLAWRGLRRAGREPSWAGLPVLAAGLGGHLWAQVLRAPYLSACMLLLSLAGLALWWGGWPALRAAAFPLAFCTLAVPLPLTERLAFPLQAASARAAAGLARLWGVPATFAGGEVALENCALTVGAPCSGLRSIVAMAALGALAAWSLAGPSWGRAMTFLAAVPVAWLTNALRVAALLTVAHLWGADAALGTFHTVSSPLFFVVGVAALLALAWGMGCRDLRSDL